METYFNHLMSSSLPIPLWALILFWLILYAVSQVLFRKANALRNKQTLITTGHTGELVREQNWKLSIVQVLFTSAIFASATLIGGAFFVFFAGGWIVITAASIPVNLSAILFRHALTQPDAGTGSVILSNRLAVKDAAFKLLGLAVFCLLLGLVMAHLALLGGAFFLFVTASGYLRKVKKKIKSESSA